MPLEAQLAEAYCKFLSGIDWSDDLILAGSKEGRNKFLSNAFLSLSPGINKYHRTHLVSAAALRQLRLKSYSGLICEHVVPKARYIQSPCEELASRGELTTDFVTTLLKRYWRLATITAAEDAKLHRALMPQDWDGNNVLARYEAAGIGLQRNPYYPAELMAS
jgi:hypothetical protein